MNDLKFAFRQLLKNPGFTAMAVLTLALGIGANTAMFSVINAALLRPLPFSKPDELIGVWQEYPKRGWTKETFSLPNFIDLQQATNVFRSAGAYSLSAHTLTEVGQPELLNSIRMTVGLLPTLGVSPVLGRNFREEEDRAETGLVVLLGDGLWRRRFQADPGVIGRSIRLNDVWTATIVGVLPRNFRIGAESPDLCLPLRLDPAKAGRGQRGLQVIARQQPDVSAQQLRETLTLIATQLRAADPWANADIELSSLPLHEHLVAQVRLSLVVLGGAVGFVLLIGCANIANLSLARAFGRRREMIIRLAIGAGRWRLARQLFTESLVLSLVGGSAGMVLASWGISLARSLLAARLPEASDLSLDATVLTFSLAASILTGVLCGLLPALSASRVDLAEGLNEGNRAATTGGLYRRMRGTLVAAEISLAFVLLVGAGLLLRSLDRLLAVHPGFDPAKLLAVQTTLTGNRYNFNGTAANPFPARRAAVSEMIAHLENLPGVQAVTFGTSMPFEDDMDASGAAIEGKSFRASDSPFVHLRGIHANYFQTLRTPLLEGRQLTAADNESAQKVGVINRALARRFWPGESALGKRIRPDALQTTEWLTVVGIVADMKNESLAKPARPELYYPYAQFPTRGVCALVRTTVPPLTLAESARQQIWKVDGNLAIVRTKTMEETIRHSASSTQLQSLLLGAFAGFALLLAAAGIYSVLAYSMSQRSREIGIRIALGAQVRHVYALALHTGLKPVLVGLGIGVVSALALTRFLSRLLFEVGPTDLVTFSLVTLILALTALAACLVPARRATRVDPMAVLPHE